MNFGRIDGLLPPTLLDAASLHARAGGGFSEYPSGRSLTYADLARAADDWVEALLGRGVKPGDTLFHFAEDRLDFIPLLVACHAAGIGLVLCPAQAKHAHAALALRQSGATLVVGSAAMRKEWASSRHGGAHWLTPQEAQNAVSGAQRRQPLAQDPAKCAVGLAEDSPRPGPVWLTYGALHRTVTSFLRAYPVGPGDRILSASPPLTSQGLCSAVIIPIMLGASVVFVEHNLLDRPAGFWHAAMRTGATICELPADAFERLLRHDLTQDRELPTGVRFLLAGCGILPDATRRAAERAWRTRIYDGYGSPPIGFWAACRAYDQTASALSLASSVAHPPAFAIRKLRTPLALLSSTEVDPAALGEILLHQPELANGHAREHRTGDLGALIGDGQLVVVDRLANVAVREGRAILMTDIDRSLAEHPGIHASRTFHEHGNGPSERVISACVTDLDAAEIQTWLAARVDSLWRPDAIVKVGRIPTGPGLFGPVARLREMVSGAACNEVVAGLTARRFRRNPPYKEPELRALVQQALLGMRPLEFFMFWGCGPRRDVAEPELGAIAAVHDLLDTVRRASVEARLDIIFTDVHASSNGRAPDHFNEYFAQMERAAAGPGISFRRESELWNHGGLTLQRVRALGATAGFEEKWRQFPLRDRFIIQASRHSKMQDRAAAARQYYCICSLEREVFLAAYPDAVFLTYNGPEFNECFPDVPTLYVYPGPRGRTDKPWFVHGPEPASSDQSGPDTLSLAS